MISGATLLDFYDRYSLNTYIKKRFFKSFIPFCFWSFIGLLYLFILSKINNSSFDFLTAIKLFFEGKAVGYYWFFIPLFVVYLFIPFFAAIPNDKKNVLLTVFIVFCFVFNSAIPFVISIFKLEEPAFLQYMVYAGYVIFAPLGYLISKNNIKPLIRVFIYLFGIAGLLLHMIGTQIMSIQNEELITIFKGYLNVPSILYSIAVFLLIKQVGLLLQKNDKVCKAVFFLSRYTFSSFLIHFYFLTVLSKLLNENILNSLFYRLLIPVPIFALIVLLVWALKKIPYFNKFLDYILPS